MNFLIAAWYEFLKNVRDVKMVAIMVVFPIITIYMLGTAVAGFFSKDVKPGFEIAYVNLDDGAVGSAFGTFLENKDISSRLDVKAYPGMEQAKQAVDDGRADAMVYLPQGLTQAVARGEKQAITLYGKDALAFVDTLVSGFASGFNTQSAIARTAGHPVEIAAENSVERVSRIKNDAVPSLKDYYAVLVLLQILVAGGIFGVYVTTRNYGSDMHIRIHALPVNKWTLLYGRLLGSTVYLCLTTAVIIAVTGAAFGINWGGNALVMAGTILLFCFLMVGIGAIFGRVFGKFTTAVMAVLALLFFFGVASGAVSPTSGVTALAFLTPNYYAKVLLFGSIYGYPAGVMAQSALWLAALAAVTYGALTALMRRNDYDNL